MSILVIAPHPDDEVLGCGGAVANHVNAGETVTLCLVTDAYTPDWSEAYIETREKEIASVTESLGITETYRLGYPTAKLDTVARKELNSSIAEVVDDCSPDRVYLPHPGDIHIDHQIVFNSGLVATRPHRCEVNTILAYETVSETEWGHNGSDFSPDMYIDITDTLEDKLAAMAEYDSELRESPHPRSLDALEALAVKRGSEVARAAAEAFEVVRTIESEDGAV